MGMTSAGAFPRALAAARPPEPPPTITTRGALGFPPSAPLIELRLASFIHPFLKLLRPEISENLSFFSQTAIVRSEANRRPPMARYMQNVSVASRNESQPNQTTKY